jgi:hypothetical protein
MEEWRYSATILTSLLDGGEFSASQAGRFTHRETGAGTHCVGGSVDPRACLDVVGKRKISCPCRKLPDTDRLVFSLVAIPTELSWLQVIPGVYYIGGWMDSRERLGPVAQRKVLSPAVNLGMILLSIAVRPPLGPYLFVSM